TSTAFSNVPPGQKFKVGDFYYHNGSTYYDSHATGVKLRISIDLPERGQAISFDLNLDLVNTENDPDDAAASADYVRITNLSQNIPLQINGVNYKIVLEFGATDSFGFSNGSQFHVYEGATGQGELLGTFLPR
ncbi:MAG TPA: choice-of-anchor K domain-containing protein, partial [Bacteroidia bacterium]|nr:choice-of-anchor K domain-containing protein [Bacteroidia bacterium]